MKESFKEWIIDNGSYKLVALFITLILWVSVLGRKETTTWKDVSLQFLTTSDKIITNVSTRAVRFEVAGSKRALRKFITDKMEPLVVDLNGRNAGRILITVPDDSLKLPFGVKVLSVTPPTVVVDIEDVAQKKVPIIISWMQHEQRMIPVKVEPAEIEIEGGTSALAKIQQVTTQDISFRDIVEIDGVRVIKTKIKAIEVEGVKPLSDQNVTITF